MTFLIANWRYALAIGLFAIYSAFVYRIGGSPARAELAALRAAGEAQNIRTAKIEDLQKEVSKNVAKQTRSATAASDDYWLRYRSASQLPGTAAVASGATTGSTPATSDTARCSEADGAADAITVLGLQGFYEGLRAAQK